MPERYLSFDEVMLELGLGRESVRKLLRDKLLIGIPIASKLGGWRILDPAPALRRQLLEPKLIDVAIITRAELAEITGLKPGTLRWHALHGRLKGTRSGKVDGPVFHTIRQLREFLAWWDKQSGRGKHSYSQLIVDWLKRYMEELKPNGEIIDRLIKEAVILPEPQRSEMVLKLWTLFDQVNDLLKECQKR